MGLDVRMTGLTWSSGSCFFCFFYPGTDAAVQIPVAGAVARHVVRLAQRLDAPQVTGENLHRRGRHKDVQNYRPLFHLRGLKTRLPGLLFQEDSLVFHPLGILLQCIEMKARGRKKKHYLSAKNKVIKDSTF